MSSPSAADERVGARAAIERVVAEAPPVMTLFSGVARAGECGGAGEGQVLDVDAQRVGRERRLHGVGAGVGCLRHDLAGRIDDVGVIAEAADERVLARAAVEDVVALAAVQRVIAGIAEERVVGGAAGDDVVQDVAAAREGAATDEREILDVRAQRVGRERRL